MESNRNKKTFVLDPNCMSLINNHKKKLNENLYATFGHEYNKNSD
jgi:hypothetical protein